MTEHENLRQQLLRASLRIRMVEEKIVEVYASDVIQSPVHLSIGQEAVAVGLVHAMDSGDFLYPNYRGHAYVLARGVSLEAFFAELMGRAGGMSKGKAGSMHLSGKEVGVMGASAIVASTIPHAVGGALADRVLGLSEKRRLFVTVFGDGATEQGVFYESLNFASVHDLPVVFVCEDNGLAVHTAKQARQGFSLEDLCRAFSIRFFQVIDSADPMNVLAVASEATNYARSGKPVVLHVNTYRYQEHVGPGQDYDEGYRDRAELLDWLNSDPLHENPDLMGDIVKEIRQEIESAFENALRSPVPGPEELLTDVI